MIKKRLFAIASVTSLSGLVTTIVAATSGAGCSSTGDPVANVTDASSSSGDVKPPKEAAPPPDAPDETTTCKDPKASFTAPTINPPAALSKTACTDAIVNA